MRILIASQFLPWPLIDGGRVAQYRTFEALQDACSFTLVVPVHSLEEETNAKVFSEKFPNVRVRPVRYIKTDAPAPLSKRLVKFARRVRNRILPRRNSEPGQATPHEPCPYYPFESLNPDFVTAVEEEFIKGCDIFQAEFADMLTLGPMMQGRAPSMFVHLQLHFVYARRFMEANCVKSAYPRYLTEKMIQEEAAYLKTFDATIVLSEVDHQSLNTFCPELEIAVSPCPSPEEPMLVALHFGSPIKHFVFVASEAHRPNADGLKWFLKEVWPIIKSRLPGAIIEVIGQWSQTAQTSLPNYQDIQFAGFVPEVGVALQRKIMIVPVWIGSGIRTKILAAWGASCPVVTTTVGVEGLPGVSGEHFLVADDAPAFAAACLELSQNLKTLNRLATNGLALVKDNFSLAAVRKTRIAIYEKLLADHAQPRL